jgi:hypothetical protein
VSAVGVDDDGIKAGIEDDAGPTATSERASQAGAIETAAGGRQPQQRDGARGGTNSRDNRSKKAAVNRIRSAFHHHTVLDDNGR